MTAVRGQMSAVSKATAFSVEFLPAPRSLLPALTALLFALCWPVDAQQPGKMPRVGLLTTGGAAF
jgi:hypothetical protein